MLISEHPAKVSGERIRRDLFSLCRDPLLFRKVNYTRSGKAINSLEEADAYIQDALEACGYTVSKTTHGVQAFRCDSSKPLHHWYSPPDPSDPYYDVANLEAARRGAAMPDEIIQLISHKDSMSWIDTPGAHDNAVGTVANLEIARIISEIPLRRSVRFLFCNEEHTPWTSRFAAEAASKRGDRIIAVLNVDSIDGKSDEEMAEGKMTHVVAYSTEEGRALAGLMIDCGRRYKIELDVRSAYKENVNDDDGMFINAGYRTAVMNLGSWPYADSEYHLAGDVPERVNIENVVRSVRLLVATILELDEHGAPAAARE